MAAPFAELFNIGGTMTAPGQELSAGGMLGASGNPIQWGNAELIQKLIDAGAITKSADIAPSGENYAPIAGTTSLNWQKAWDSGLAPQFQSDPFKIGLDKGGGYIPVGTRADTHLLNPNLVWNDPNYGEMTFQKNVAPNKEKGLLGALPTIGKAVTIGGLGLGFGTVLGGALGSNLLGNLLGKLAVGQMTSGGQMFGSLASGAKPGSTGGTMGSQGNALALLLALLASKGQGR